MQQLMPRSENVLARRTTSIAAGAVVLVVASLIAASTFGWLFGIVWFFAKIALIAALVVFGVRLLVRRF